MSKFLTYRKNDNPSYKLYTDGSCREMKYGAWAYVLEKDNVEIDVGSDKATDTTNNRMELLAIIRGLQKIPDNESVCVYTDSRYTIVVMNFAFTWNRLGWVNYKGDTISNVDLIEELIVELKRLKVNGKWVPRNSTAQNAKCDEIAQKLTLEMSTTK